ncbi:tetraspanin-8-like [Lampris incognitus]|uniref:tetraspanin-8-like n=1 Tax=Lampris incognitus TaxID=2546036 RepID=UPI0024B5F653|nr:tetraspanin-8-like [Lampris incognitus]
MSRINGCLKCLSIFFNVVFGIVGVLLIIGAVKASGYSHELAITGSPGLGWYWLFAIGIILVSCLGIFAACSEKEIVLKVFAGIMVAGLLIMLIFGIIIASYRNKMKNAFDSTSAEMVHAFMADEGFREFLDEFQQKMECCGVEGAKDWETEIRPSCECSSYSGCVAKPQGMAGPDKVYKQSCKDILFSILDIAFKVGMGMFFGFAITALLGLLVSLLMIHQVRRDDSLSGGQSIAMKGCGY